MPEPQKVCHVVAITCQKGGVGKTTIAVNLAVEAMRRRMSVAVIDMDAQGSTSLWKTLKPRTDFAVITLAREDRGLLPDAITGFREQGADLIIIDTPPFAQDIPYEVMLVADYLLIPTRPAPFDLAASLQTVEQAQALNKRGAIVLNLVRPNATAVVEQNRELFDKAGYPVSPVILHTYAVHEHAQGHGLAVVEHDPKSTAADEVRALFKWLMAQLAANDTAGKPQSEPKSAATA